MPPRCIFSVTLIVESAEEEASCSFLSTLMICGNEPSKQTDSTHVMGPAQRSGFLGLRDWEELL